MPPNQNTITPPPVLPNQTPPSSFATPSSNLYPIININHPEKPNRFYAVPLIGFLVKIIILIPVYLWLGLIGIVASSLSSVNSFVVLFTGKYWIKAYNLNLGFIRLSTKTTYFLYGLTDKYPGFNFTTTDFSIDIPYPEHPSKFFAIPIFGGLVRIILLIPYYIYQNVIANAARIGVFFSFFPVLFMGKYPESTFELGRDSVRVEQSTAAYIAGFSDKYPNFHISMSHKTIKIILITIAALWTAWATFDDIYKAVKPPTALNKNLTPSINSPFQLRDKF